MKACVEGICTGVVQHESALQLFSMCKGRDMTN